MATAKPLGISFKTWGGRRVGSGRKPNAGRRAVAHRRRHPHDRHCPVHATLRASHGLPSLRGAAVFAAVRSALARSSSSKFRVLQFSVQADHVHLLIEAEGGRALSRGLQGLAIRVAKTVNRVLCRRGRVWGDRFHARMLKTPREVRNALVYVLNNFRKHVLGARGIDPRSSGAWFSGWRDRPGKDAIGSSPVAPARTWLARVGWLRHGRIAIVEGPRRRTVPSQRRRI